MSTVGDDLTLVQARLHDSASIWPRIESRLNKDNDCWVWTGTKGPSGYGQIGIRVNGKPNTRYVHRISYQVFIGPIPKDREIDHLCRNRSCANPKHLELVTHRENILRGNTFAAKQAAQTHCWRGHEFDFKNTQIGTKGERRCRKCNVIKTREHNKRCRQLATT